MKKLNYLLILSFVAITFSNCQQPRPINHSKKDIFKIDIKWVDFDIESIVNIDCDKFDSTFGVGSYKTSLSSQKEINGIVNLIRVMKRMDNAYQPDVRGKMWLYHANHTIDTICFSNIVLRFKGNSYKTPSQLIKYLVEKGNQQPKK
jgi:hypothetical protein